MDEKKGSGNEITVDEAMRRFRPLFLMLMLIPFMGMIAAMVIIYILKPNNMFLIEVLLLISTIVFLWTTYRFARQMNHMTQDRNPEPASKWVFTSLEQAALP